MSEQLPNQDVYVRVKDIIAELESTHINSWNDLEKILEDSLEEVKRIIHSPIRVDVYAKPKLEEEIRAQPCFQRMLGSIWFVVTVFAALICEVVRHPTRSAILMTDSSTRSVRIEEYLNT